MDDWKYMFTHIQCTLYINYIKYIYQYLYILIILIYKYIYTYIYIYNSVSHDSLGI